MTRYMSVTCRVVWRRPPGAIKTVLDLRMDTHLEDQG